MDIFQHCRSISKMPFCFEPIKWRDSIECNCYEYLLNFQNVGNTRLIVGSTINDEFKPCWTEQKMINTLKKELSGFGFQMEKTGRNDMVPKNTLKFFISRSICGDYHFYRMDMDGRWSHKFSYFEPTDLDFDGKKITLPELVCNTDKNCGYYLLSK